jgi:wyosine [tRNA(Phe)-imidazoG37] synthetase (radical SAM superfamily)
LSKKCGIDIQNSPFHPFNSQKILVHGRRLEAIINEQYLPPIVLNLDVTGKCQYRCGHCHHRRKQIKNQCLPDLSGRLARTLPYFLREWKVDGARVQGCCIVGSQGDALLYPRLPKLLKELHFSKIQIGLVSNGYAFTEQLLNYAAFYSLFIGFSMDAGTKEGYQKIKNCPKDGWDRVLKNIGQLIKIIDKNKLRNDVGWKILVLPDTYQEIYESCAIAKDLGCRYVQIRPADLPEESRKLINIDSVEMQITKAINDFEVPGEFEIVGVRHKFTPSYTQILPKYCYLTPLTVTITSDGKAYACVDRRCDRSVMLADCQQGGWQALKEVWGSAKHISIVHDTINNEGRGPACSIRCSNYGYDKFFLNYFVEDNVDRNMI